jgi:hypothetical protein
MGMVRLAHRGCHLVLLGLGLGLSSLRLLRLRLRLLGSGRSHPSLRFLLLLPSLLLLPVSLGFLFLLSLSQ